MSVYVVAGSNPVDLRDSLGLDWFDDVDDTIGNMNAERVAFAEQTMEVLKAVVKNLAWTAFETVVSTMFPPAGVVFAAYGAAGDIDDILENGLGWGNGNSLALNAAGGLGSFEASMNRLAGRIGK